MYAFHKGFSIDGNNALEEYGGGREEEHNGMQNNLEVEGSGDEVEGMKGSDDIEDVGVFLFGRGCGHFPRSKKSNHSKHATRS